MSDTFYDQVEEQLATADQTYTADLQTLNNSGANGRTYLFVNDGSLFVAIAASGLVPNVEHAQHIHGTFGGGDQPTDATTPTINEDDDLDGFVELAEGAETYGPVIIPLVEEDGTAPAADANGNLFYTRTFDLSDPSIYADGFGPDDLTPLTFREIVMHGVDVPDGAGAGTGGEVDGGVNGYIPLLPASAGEIEEKSAEQTSNLIEVDRQGVGTRQIGTDADEVLRGGPGDDVIGASGGNDLVVGGDGDDELFGGAGNDTISGQSGDDRIVGADGDDNLFGIDGDDVISGQDGNDLIRGGLGNDSLFGGAGDDAVAGQEGDDQIRGGSGNDFLTGNQGDDRIGGQSGNDELRGGQGNDSLFGGEGFDVLIGGGGDDILGGGDGSDLMVYTAGGGDDAIRDFEPGVDFLDLSDPNLDLDERGEDFFILPFAQGSLLTFDDVDGSIFLAGVRPGDIGDGDIIL